MNFKYMVMEYRNSKWIVSLSRILLIAVMIVALIHFPVLSAEWVAVIIALLGYAYGSKRKSTPAKDKEAGDSS